nr:hypothetical protein [Candidatus Sigynarchaeota archaeon]
MMLSNDIPYKIEIIFRNLATITLISWIVTPFTSVFGWPYAVIVFQVLTLLFHRRLINSLRHDVPEEVSRSFATFTRCKWI